MGNEEYWAYQPYYAMGIFLKNVSVKNCNKNIDINRKIPGGKFV